MSPLRRVPLLLLLWSGLAQAAPGTEAATRRFAVIAGINDGGPERIRLRYATTDAQSFARVLDELGGVAPEDQALLLDGGLPALRRAMTAIAERVRADQARGGRTELIFYYSGHSDEDGLLIQGERLSYRELRALIEGIPAGVRLAILDSCASGAVTRGKGGVARPPFLSDRSSRISGQAFLTSSSADEVSQESDAIGASYFSQALVTGLRGAADSSHDGKVTLNEAYHFAFQETLARTEATQRGAQHPAFDMQLVGTGDLVLTDLHGTILGSEGAIRVPDGLVGRVFIRDERGALVAELAKVPGRGLELALPPGSYQVRLDREGTVSETRLQVRRGEAAEIDAARLSPARLEPTASRGDDVIASREQAVTLQIVPLSLPSQGAVTDHLALGLVWTHSDRLAGFSFGPAVDSVGDDSRGMQLGGGFAFAGRRLHGFQLAGAATWAGGSVEGAQLAAGVSLGGAVTGFQLGGGGSVARGAVLGLQGAGGFTWSGGGARGAKLAGGFNVAGGSVTGVEAAGGFNVAVGHLTGLQAAGGFNVAAQGASGLQLAGGFNVAADQGTGAQLAGGVNLAARLRGAQVAVINLAGEADAQVGVINIAGVVHGSQVGVINIARSMEGVPVGVVNVFGNGLYEAQAFGSELASVNGQVMLGMPALYAVFAAGGRPETAAADLYLAGGPGHRFRWERWTLDVDALCGAWSSHDLLRSTDLLVSLRATVGYQLAGPLTVIGGVSANAAFWFGEQESGLPQRLSADWTLGGTPVHAWPGLLLGVRI